MIEPAAPAYPHLPDPIAGQTKDTIAAFFPKCVVGDDVVIRSTQGAHLRYRRAKVTQIAPGKVYTDVTTTWSGPCWYTKRGRNALHPTGKCHLVEPTPGIWEIATAGGRPIVGELCREIARLPRLGGMT
jgi:hypothetical protein